MRFAVVDGRASLVRGDAAFDVAGCPLPAPNHLYPNGLPALLSPGTA